MTHLPLETSRLIYELVGEYPTEHHYNHENKVCDCALKLEGIPAPNFAEVIRVLPRLCKVKRKEEEKVKGWISNAWLEHHIANDALDLYMNAPSEPKGMAAVNSFLLKLLK